MTDPADAARDLVAEGFEYRFTASEPKLSDHVAEYTSLGFEVRLVPVTTDESPTEHCEPCIEGSAPVFAVWVRPRS